MTFQKGSWIQKGIQNITHKSQRLVIYHNIHTYKSSVWLLRIVIFHEINDLIDTHYAL